ncbi:PilC/PilY family type IV pilus protein [Conchiformibius kuhniae]|uniref:PilC/PilY family type IV pilus protein n=2 Tax=Conchiformibius kuhniae TaxID=211502 RepID=A0ABD8B7P2_9NEIS|nr:PilC/PilY family type IV pilus protein [Conchiformibius kuhniae]
MSRTDPSGVSYDAPPFDKQTIETYSITFGTVDGISTGYQEYMSGGTTAKGLVGQVFNATDEDALNEVFKKIFDDLVGKSLFEPPASFSGISPTVSSDEATRKLPNMAATTHLSMKTGSSEIYFYEVDTANQSSTTVVKNRYTKPNFSNRRVLISDGKNTVTWLERFAGNNAFFGIPDAANNRDEWQRSMIPWIARSKADALVNSSTNALKYRNRTDLHDGVIRNTRNMGDVVYSPILAYGPNENGRQKYLLTAANDGMVYLFRSHNDRNHPYDLKLNYIPAGMERESEDDTMGKHFKDIVHPEYVQNYKEAPHQFMVNGGFVIRTMDDTGPQQIFMAGNMGQGGRGMYALNVGGPSRANPGQQVGIDAPQDQWPQTVPLMETPKGSANRDMGYTINAPQIGRVALTRSVSKDPDKKAEMTTDLFDLRYAVFVGSGVSNPFARAAGGGADNTESALYLYSPFDNLNVGATPPAGQTSGSTAHHPLSKGQLIKKLAVEKSVGKGGLAQPTLVDINFDGAIDIVYAGDYGGGVYRFDLRGEPNDWTVHKIFQTVNGQPITSAPAVFRNEENKYIVVFGTGSDLYQSDLTDTNVQSMYGVYEDLTDFSPTVKYQSDLVQQTMTQSQVSVKGKNYDVRKLSDNGAEDPNIKGWYFDFPAGERVVVKPNVLLKSVLFTTRSYRLEREQSGNLGTGDKCSAETSSERSSGESWVMQVKVDNGGNIPGKDGDEAYAYADFLGQYERAPDSDKYTRPDELFAGFRSEGGIVNMALLFGVNKDPNGVGGINSAYTRDGDAGDSGIDPPPAADGNHLNNITKFCVDDDDNKLLYNNTGDSKGLSDNFVLIHANKCPSQQKGIVRRLSWRELF